MGLRVPPRDQATLFAVEDSNISTIEEGESGPQRDQEHAHQMQCSKDIRWKHPELWHEGNWMLHDNASSQPALVTREFLGPTAWWPYRRIWPISTSSSSRRWSCSWRVAVLTPRRISSANRRRCSTRLKNKTSRTRSSSGNIGAQYRCTRGLFWRGWCPNFNQVLSCICFSFHPVLHDWCKKIVVCYPVCAMMHIKYPLLLIGKSSPCGSSGFPF